MSSRRAAPGTRQETGRHGRADCRRSAVTEVAAPIDGGDLAEGIAADEAVHLDPFNRYRDLAVEHDVEGARVRPSLGHHDALRVSLLAADGQEAFGLVVGDRFEAAHPAQIRDAEPGRARRGRFDRRARDGRPGRHCCRKIEIGHVRLGDAIDREGDVLVLGRVVEHAQPDRVPPLDQGRCDEDLAARRK